MSILKSVAPKATPTTAVPLGNENGPSRVERQRGCGVRTRDPVDPPGGQVGFLANPLQ